MREEPDEIYQGPRHPKPLSTAPAEPLGTSIDAAFAEGRRMFLAGRPNSALYDKKLKGKSKSWREALRKGYAWQKARAK
jgi:hypothetical protein